MASNDDLRVALRRNDGSEVFRLKSDTVETKVENGLVTDSVVSGVSRAVVGGKLVLELQAYTINFDVQGMTSNDYPNAGTYGQEGHDYGFREEIERASKEWGYTKAAGFDTLEYDGRSIDGVITSLNISEDTANRPARTYDGVLEWTFLDAYIS